MAEQPAKKQISVVAPADLTSLPATLVTRFHINTGPQITRLLFADSVDGGTTSAPRAGVCMSNDDARSLANGILEMLATAGAQRSVN